MKDKQVIRFFLDDDLHQKFKNYVTSHCCDFSKVIRKLIRDLVNNETKLST